MLRGGFSLFASISPTFSHTRVSGRGSPCHPSGCMAQGHRIWEQRAQQEA
jgi:hypothetical protein